MNGEDLLRLLDPAVQAMSWTELQNAVKSGKTDVIRSDAASLIAAMKETAR